MNILNQILIINKMDDLIKEIKKLSTTDIISDIDGLQNKLSKIPDEDIKILLEALQNELKQRIKDIK